MAPIELSRRFVDAVAFATDAHQGQGRKGTDIPYVSHLLAVTAIVLEHGGDEEQAIAALLHDVIEDQGGDAARQRIRERFGDRVTAMVDDCTDTDATPKPPWPERKRAYIEHVSAARADSLLVSMADKLHNVGAILRDLRREGIKMFERFNAGPEEVVWYYASLVEAFEARRDDLDEGGKALLAELSLVVGEMEAAVGGAA